MRKDNAIVFGIGLMTSVPDPLLVICEFGGEPSDVIAIHVQLWPAVYDPLGHLYMIQCNKHFDWPYSVRSPLIA